jgi:hypothetical protein
MRIVLCVGWIVTSLFSTARYTEIEYTNKVYEPQVGMVRLVQADDINNTLPLIVLNSGQQLALIFDELRGSNDFYNYTFIHCSSNWEPSNLQVPEYIEGNTVGTIDQFSFSNNTFQTYVEYRVNFPSQDVNILKSGNYLLKVYRNFDEADVLLTRRFMVLENRTIVGASARPATDAEYRFRKQEVDFTVKHDDYIIPNPFIDVNAVIMQNNQWNNAIYGMKPQFSNNQTLNFNYEDINLFPGIHEFRFYDTRSLRSYSTNVVDKYNDSLINVVLRPDEIRAHKSYVLWKDFNGKMVINNRDGSEAAMDDDYVLTHFFLKSDQPLKNDKPVYVFGEFSDWQLSPKYRMTYLEENGGYYLKVKVKQGYINYLFVQEDEENGFTTYLTEGNHAATENEYSILIYHRNQTLGYDELIGFSRVNSMN